MNYRFVARQLGLLLVVMSAALAATMLYEFWLVWQGVGEGEADAARALGIATVIGALVGGVIWGLTRKHDKDWTLARREALLLVATSWVVGAALAALPYYLWARFDPADPVRQQLLPFTKSYFEAMSGLTTTGSSILGEIEALPRGLLLWRALTQWLGGLGIVMLFVALLPSLGAGAKRIVFLEASGPAPTGLRPRIADTARTLWFIYLGFTVAEVLLLKACGLSLFEALCETFTTMSTGGFSIKNASIAGYYSWAAELVLILFMVLASINFGLYYRLAIGQRRVVWRDTELRLYLALVGGMAVMIVLPLVGRTIIATTGDTYEGAGWFTAIRYGIFNLISIQSTCGYGSADTNQWPISPRMLLVFASLVGGCAGSTAGGIKVIRLWLVFRVLLAELERAFRPRVVRPVKLNGVAIDAETQLSAVAYVLGFAVLILGGAALLALFEESIDLVTAITACVATICTTGPGMGQVGSASNFGWFSDPSMIVLSVLMVVGRLEIFAILVLFTPRFWQGD